MRDYISGELLRTLREQLHMTQGQLGEKIAVSDKTISKWETGRGLPDIAVVPELASALHVSVAELMSGIVIRNRNISGNLRRLGFSVCPVCGNVVQSVGEVCVSCCGIALPRLEAEAPDAEHTPIVSVSDSDWLVTFPVHRMEKEHFLSFAALVTTDTVQLVKLYPEQSPQLRFSRRGIGTLYYYCSRHGLFQTRLTVPKEPSAL